MKELTIEEKAQAYDEAIKRAEAVTKVAQNQKEVYDCIITIFPELKESENDKIRKRLIEHFSKWAIKGNYCLGMKSSDILAWLEKQGEHANFLSKIQVGDKVTRNEGGVLVNISQLERIAKPRRVKPAEWSEEDESMLECALDMVKWFIGRNETKCRSVSNWLKSLKQRIGG